MKKNKIQDWEVYYKEETNIETMPWFYNKLDPDLQEAINSIGITEGSFLDIGTGPGTQAIELAKNGFRVTASDYSQTAIEKALKRSKKEGVTIECLQDDVLNTKIEEAFDFVLDRGCFHVFDEDKRYLYLKNITKIVRQEGYLFLKCFSHLQPGDKVPYRYSPGQIKSYFEQQFEIIHIKDTVYFGTLNPYPKALFTILKKK